MSILIKGMEMPKDSYVAVKIFPDGRVDTIPYVQSIRTELIDGTKAVSIPPHGDLIDRDALPWEKQGLLLADEDWALSCSIIDEAPTIIPADADKGGGE